MLSTYIACTKSDWGKNIVNQFNSIIKKHGDSKEVFSFIGNWLAGDSLDYYRQMFKEFHQEKRLSGQ